MLSRFTCVRLLTLAIVLVALSACSDESVATNAAAPASGVARAAESATDKRLAVSHAFTLRMPGKEVEAVQQKHLAECARLGCMVLNSRLDRYDDGRVNASLSVRIAPTAYGAFTAALMASPSEMVMHAETAEDKTAPLLDVEKRLEVKIALRDRLSAMLREPGKKNIAELASLEKDIAQLQGDIEAAIAQRDYLTKITETVKVDVGYSGVVAQAGSVDYSPIDRAIRGSGRTLAHSVAALISFIAVIIPWLPPIALVIWGIRRGLRRWRTRKVI